MPEQWRVRVRRLPRYQLPLVLVKLNNWLHVRMVLSSGEPYTSVAPRIAEYLLAAQAIPQGRRVIPSDSGPVIARTLRLQSLIVPTAEGGPLEFAPWTVAIAVRPQALGVGGLLGTDILARFSRLQYEFGPPDRLLLETDS